MRKPKKPPPMRVIGFVELAKRIWNPKGLKLLAELFLLRGTPEDVRLALALTSPLTDPNAQDVYAGLHVPPKPPRQLGNRVPIIDRSHCREQVCTCHDDSAWIWRSTYPFGCTTCGCRWKTIPRYGTA